MRALTSNFFFLIILTYDDIPKEQGVCTAVIIPMLRRINFYLQNLAHEDMKRKWEGIPYVIHYICGGTSEDDKIFTFKLTGHYRWFKY